MKEVLSGFKTEKYKVTLWEEMSDPDYVVRGTISKIGYEELSIGEIVEKLRNVEKYRKFCKSIKEIAQIFGKKPNKAVRNNE